LLNRTKESERPVSVLSKVSEAASLPPPPSPLQKSHQICTICRSGPWHSGGGGAVPPFAPYGRGRGLALPPRRLTPPGQASPPRLPPPKNFIRFARFSEGGRGIPGGGGSCTICSILAEPVFRPAPPAAYTAECRLRPSGLQFQFTLCTVFLFIFTNRSLVLYHRLSSLQRAHYGLHLICRYLVFDFN